MAEINIPINVIDNFTKTLESLDKSVSKIAKVTDSLNGKQLQDLTKNLDSINKSAEKTAKGIESLSARERVLGTTLGTVAVALGLQSRSVQDVITKITGLNKTTLVSKFNLDKLAKTFVNTGKVTGTLAKTAIVLDKGLVGLSINLGTTSAALFGLSKILGSTENGFADASSQAILFASILTGTLSVVLSALILNISSLAFNIGTELVKSAQKATQSFIELDKKTFVFERTLTGFNKAFGESIGTVDSWTNSITKVSDATGFTEKSLRGAVTEIIATTSAMGFNEAQQKKLLDVTTDYASFLGDDVVQTTIEFISALNGSAQSVQKYGVKLGASNIQQKLFSKGSLKNFKTLTNSEKVQLRFNSLLSQYAPIAGNAAAVTETLAGQEKVLENNIARVNASFGEGASIIENNNLVSFAFNTVLGNLNESLLSAAGFVTALGGRLLQIGGLVLGLSFKFLAVIKVIKVLNILLQTSFSQALFSAPIPFFNKSIQDLIRSSGAAFVSFKSLRDILKTFGSVLVSQTKIIIAGLLGINAASLTLSSVLKGVLLRSLSAVRVAVSLLGRSLFALAVNPVFLAIATLTGLIFGLVKAFEFVNEQTGVFTTLFGVAVEVLQATTSILSPLISLFKSFGQTISNVANIIAGKFIRGLSFLVQKFLDLIKLNPFKIFDDSQISQINAAQRKLASLNKELVSVGDNISKVSKKGISVSGKVTTKVDTSFTKNINKIGKDTAVSFADNLKSGKAGARTFVKNIGAGIATAFGGPVAGQVVGPLIELAQMSREEIRQSIRGFVDALPEIINTIAENIPFIVEQLALALADKADEIAKALSNAMPAVAIGLAKAMPSVALALAKAMPGVALELFKSFNPLLSATGRDFAEEVLKGAFDFVAEIIKGAGRFIGELIKGIGKGVGDLGGGILDSIPGGQLFDIPGIGLTPFDVIKGGNVIPVPGSDQFGFSGGFLDSIGGGLFGGIGDVLGFAAGGLVPSGFDNDSGIFRLSSGEFVVDNSLTPQLADFLAGQQGGGDSDITNSLLAELVELMSQPQTVTSEVQLNQETFADLILQLNRNNARIEA